jgi:hypothetical protein
MLFAVSSGLVLDILLLTSWFGYWYCNDWQLYRWRRLSRCSASVARQGGLWLDGQSPRFPERGMPFGSHCLHEAQIASKKDRPTYRLGSTQGCTVLFACPRCMLPHATSLLCILLRQSPLNIVLHSALKPG